MTRAISFSCLSVIANNSVGPRLGYGLLSRPPTGKKTFACGGREKIDFELRSENAGVAKHQTKRSIARRTVGDGAAQSAPGHPLGSLHQAERFCGQARRLRQHPAPITHE